MMRYQVAGWMCLAAVGGAVLPAAYAADAAPAAVQHTVSPLEGTRWSVTVTPDAPSAKKGAKPFTETLIFEGGKVRMRAREGLGFEASAYSLMPAGEGWSFTARQVSQDPTKGTIRWEAVFTGETVTGTLLWTTQRNANWHYTVTGKKREPPPKAKKARR